MKAASEIVEDMLGVLRRQFYAERPERRWHVEREHLVKAITHPAWRLAQQGAELPAGAYQGILQEVIATIQRHGEAHKARNFGLYFLKCVQTHMEHRWASYYERAKTLSAAVAKALPAGAQPARGDSPVAALAEAHKALMTIKRGKAKPAQPAGIQKELF